MPAGEILLGTKGIRIGISILLDSTDGRQQERSDLESGIVAIAPLVVQSGSGIDLARLDHHRSVIKSAFRMVIADPGLKLFNPCRISTMKGLNHGFLRQIIMTPQSAFF